MTRCLGNRRQLTTVSRGMYCIPVFRQLPSLVRHHGIDVHTLQGARPHCRPLRLELPTAAAAAAACQSAIRGPGFLSATQASPEVPCPCNQRDPLRRRKSAYRGTGEAVFIQPGATFSMCALHVGVSIWPVTARASP